ncbi:MAG: N-acetyl-gamma-glutamyl-phosphate reductase [Pseudoxanthomonas suwonensis]|nr:N-acetyl-gamma-glutamyl-phosphate reductase [Pseudoxanthomonas suwonensis]
MNGKSVRLGLIGARGHVGAELIRLLASHPNFELALVSSRERDGTLLRDHHPEVTGDLRYRNVTPAQLAAEPLDAVVLALPNGMAAEYVAALDAGNPQAVVVDLSADYRFDAGWRYGLPELGREGMAGQRRISNPGCYATAMQLAIAPLKDLLEGPAQCFGVSGHSGAGTSPSDRNDEAKLRDNLMPYALTGHVHEREVTRHLDHPVEFMPHVAPHFRGITMTVNLHLREPADAAHLRERFEEAYDGERLITLQDDAPWVSAIAGRHGVAIGGLTVSDDGRRVVVVAVLDNLLKGAATQALQNLNLAFGVDELEGIPHAM